MYCKIFHTPAKHQLDSRFKVVHTSIQCPVRDMNYHINRINKLNCSVLLIVSCDNPIIGFNKISDILGDYENG